MGKVKKVSKEKRKVKKCIKRPIHQYSEESLRDALFQIRENHLSVRKASHIYGVPKTTIHDRLSGRVAEKPRRMGPPPILSIAEEKAIVQWCIDLSKCGFPRKMDDILNTVQKIIMTKHKDAKNVPFVNGRPGKKWYQAFFRRNSELTHRNAENLSQGRAVLTEETIRKWFRDLNDYLKTENAEDILLDPTRILNGDETSFTLCPKTGKVVAPRGYKNVYQIVKGKEKEALTTLLVVSASGAIAHPCVVFPYTRPPKDVRDSMEPDWCMGLSETGWMRSEVFYEYVANSLNPWLVTNNIKKPVLFFIDGHKSHLTLSLSEFCSQNDIILYALPPNATHIMQPCDVSVFRPLKSEWQATVREWQMLEENTNQTLTKAKFCPLLKRILEKENLPQTIRSGFRKCGLFPFDPDMVDYSKCVQNILEDFEGKDPNSQSMSDTDYQITLRTIKSIQRNLEERGINVDVIFEELSMAQNRHKNELNNNEPGAIPTVQLQPLDNLPPVALLTNGDIYEIDEAGNLILQETNCGLPEEPEKVLNNDDNSLQPLFKQKQKVLQKNSDEKADRVLQIIALDNTSNLLSQEIQEEGNDFEHNNNEILDNSPQILLSQKEDNYKVRDKILQNSYLDNSDNKENALGENGNETAIATESTSTENILIRLSQETKKTDEYAAMENLKVAEDNLDKSTSANIKIISDIVLSPPKTCGINSLSTILFYPKPLQKSKNTKTTTKLPSAISSEMWRQLEQEKENAKEKKIEAIQKRKEEAQKKRETKRLANEERRIANETRRNNLMKKKQEQRNKNKKQKTEGLRTEQVGKTRIKCSSCDVDLISDTEDNELKNIGCDECTRWYHLKCTTLNGHLYEQICTKDFKCIHCT